MLSTGGRICWCILAVFRGPVSQRAEPSHVQLCLCNPNTGRNAKSSLPAEVSPSCLCCGGALEEWGTGWGTMARVNYYASYFGRLSCNGIGFKSSGWWPCRNVDDTGQGRRALPRTYTNCSAPPLICTGGSVNMTFSLCVQRQHRREYLQVTDTSMRRGSSALGLKSHENSLFTFYGQEQTFLDC